ncbi:unnamed protein product, partial [marine sediment metagenome]
SNHITAWDAVKKLIAERKPYSRDDKGVADEIFKIRQKQGAGDKRRDFEISAQVANIREEKRVKPYAEKQP